MRTASSHMRFGSESGGALVLALIAVMMATLFTTSILQLTSSVTSAQAQSVDNTRAFYLAEAGLSEAYEALRVGRRGQIGSIEAPAAFGDGVVWVDATPTPDGQMRLESTAVCGMGRKTLALVVEPTEVPLGIFSDEDLVLETVLLVDGFDATELPDAPDGPIGESLFEELTVDPNDPYLHVDYENHLVFYGGTFYRFLTENGQYFRVDHRVTVEALSKSALYGETSPYEISADDFMDHDPYPQGNGSEYAVDSDAAALGGSASSPVPNPDFQESEYEGVLAYFAALDEAALGTDFDGLETDVIRLQPIDGPTFGTTDVLNGWGGSGGAVTDAVDPSSGANGDVSPGSAPATGSAPYWDAGAPTSSTPTTEIDAVDALVGSNGTITIGGGTDTVEIHGDVVPGVDGEVLLENGGYVSGSTDPRNAEVELPEVEVPTVELGAAIVHDSAFPLIVSPGTIGFEAIEVAPDAELVIRGPATVVVGTLTLAAGADLTLDTTDGDVELFVTQALDLQPDSHVSTPSQRPDELSVQISADDSLSVTPAVHLQSTATFYGTVYAPEAEVVVGGEFELYGSIAARVLDLEPGAKLHYDASVAGRMPRLVSWQIIEVPAAIQAQLSSVLLGFDADASAPLAEAHDLGGIELDIDYVDKSGSDKSYAGPEADFDWSQVAEVEASERHGWNDWEDGWHNDWWDWWGEAWWETFEESWTESWGANWGDTTKRDDDDDD